MQHPPSWHATSFDSLPLSALKARLGPHLAICIMTDTDARHDSNESSAEMQTLSFCIPTDPLWELAERYLDCLPRLARSKASSSILPLFDEPDQLDGAFLDAIGRKPWDTFSENGGCANISRDLEFFIPGHDRLNSYGDHRFTPAGANHAPPCLMYYGYGHNMSKGPKVRRREPDLQARSLFAKLAASMAHSWKNRLDLQEVPRVAESHMRAPALSKIDQDCPAALSALWLSLAQEQALLSSAGNAPTSPRKAPSL